MTILRLAVRQIFGFYSCSDGGGVTLVTMSVIGSYCPVTVAPAWNSGIYVLNIGGQPRGGAE